MQQRPVTFVAFLASALATAKEAKAGIGGYALAIIIGLSLAVCTAWMFYKLGGILADLTVTHSERRQEWYGRAFYFFTLFCLLVGAILASLLTSAVMRLVA